MKILPHSKGKTRIYILELALDSYVVPREMTDQQEDTKTVIWKYYLKI